MNKKKLNLKIILAEAKSFSKIESSVDSVEIYGVTDGKKIGTYLEHKFFHYLSERYLFQQGNSAIGIDFPELAIDMKVTSIKQPQSSCPFRSARQKIYGLGYHLLVFVYEKTDNELEKTGRLKILHTIFVNKELTADFQTTSLIRQIIDNKGNTDDIEALLRDRNLPIDETGAHVLAEEILSNPPKQGYLTISNALQWRLQYGRVIKKAGEIDGIEEIS